MKMVINSCYGGFSISEKAMEMLDSTSPYEYGLRTDPQLIEVVETLGKEANGMCANLEVVDIPDEITDYVINEYDGYETVYYVLDGKIYTA